MSDKIESFITFLVTVATISILTLLALVFVKKMMEISSQYADQTVASQTVEAYEESFMRVVEENVPSATHSYYRILVDEETGVMYYAEYADGYGAGGAAITPLYNADGTLRIYKEE